MRRDDTETWYYSAQKLAFRWDVTPGHIRELIRRGELRATKIGRVLRIHPEEVERYERQNETR